MGSFFNGKLCTILQIVVVWFSPSVCVRNICLQITMVKQTTEHGNFSINDSFFHTPYNIF